MRTLTLGRRVDGFGLVTVALSGGMLGCSSGDSGSAAGSGTYTVWDPYPQFENGSAWVKLLDKCGGAAGVTVKRSGFDTTDLTSKALLASQQSNAPDILIVDNPVVSTLAQAGVLVPNTDTKLDASAVQPNLLGAGQIGGKTYGVPIGANTLALYYNKAVLKSAGVDAASVKDWASLTAALAKVTGAGRKGITFSAIGTEEGSFQFLPWFWGSGAQLTQLDSPAGGGTAPAPTGGEFVTVPVQKKTARYATSEKLVTCLTSADNLYATDTTLSYIAPTSTVQAKQTAATPELKVWVDAVGAAKARTGDGLGIKYPKISEPMWTAMQAALSGSRSPQAALSAAQSRAAAATR